MWFIISLGYDFISTTRFGEPSTGREGDIAIAFGGEKFVK